KELPLSLSGQGAQAQGAALRSSQVITGLFGRKMPTTNTRFSFGPIVSAVFPSYAGGRPSSENRIVKALSFPAGSRGAQNSWKPTFFSHLVTGVSKNPRKLASTIGRKKSAAIFRV